MTREELLKLMRTRSPDRVAEIAPPLVAAARTMPRALVEIALGADELASSEARSLILNDVEELAIVPIIEAPMPPSIDDRTLLAVAVVDAELALRNKVVVHLERLLEDKSRIHLRQFEPKPEGAAVLEARRVCDDAYFLMRRLRHPELSRQDGPDDSESRHEYWYMHGSDGFKDQEIARARKSGDWARRLTLTDVNDYHAKHVDAPSPRPVK